MSDRPELLLVGADGAKEPAMSGIRCALVSLGCAKNLVDSETMLALLVQAGAEVVTDATMAEVVIVNTCGFLTAAREESIDRTLELARLKADGRCRALVLAGCLAQRNGQELAEHLPEVDAVIGLSEVPHIVQVVTAALEGRRVQVPGDHSYMYDYPLPRLVSTGACTAYVKISEGCSNRCAYCAIPSIRGPHRSRPMESIVAEARELVQAGIGELILIAQDTTRYGEDLYGEARLPELIERLAGIGGLVWLRVLYMHPDRVSDRLLDAMSASGTICSYFDIPLQHAHPEILRAMNRRGSEREILEMVDRIRGRLPNAVIRTTFIVGFPGETRAHFQALRDTIEQARFDRVGVFEYSREEGTPACELGGQVGEAVSRRRRTEIMRVQQGIALLANQRRLGSTFPVLVEGAGDFEGGARWVGRSYGEAPEVDGKVFVTPSGATAPRVGEFVQVTAVAAGPYDLWARPVADHDRPAREEKLASGRTIR